MFWVMDSSGNGYWVIGLDVWCLLKDIDLLDWVVCVFWDCWYVVWR